MYDVNGKCSRRGVYQPVGMLPQHTPLAMAYVPFQKWEDPYAENYALYKGTIFPSLDLPFCGKEAAINDGKQ